MSGLFITVTDAGFRALVNSSNTGTRAVSLTHIGLSAASFAAAPNLTTLPGEFKRLTTFGGAAVAKDTLHLSIRDDGPEAYSIRAFGLYLDDGTLFAVYSHPDVLMNKDAAVSLLLTADVRFQRIDVSQLVFGDTVWLNPPATETVQGVVELADRVEAVAGTDRTRAMTPDGVKAAMDARLGDAAPSPFVKSILNAASALLLRAALGLGNAAVRDEGAGKGLDADKLDGEHGAYYRNFDNLTNVPGEFTAKKHRHAWADLDGVPDTASRNPTFDEVTNKPDDFKPKPHPHSASDITSGVFAPERIPALPIARVSGLETALANKVGVTGGEIWGRLILTRDSPPPDGSAYNTGHLELKTTNTSFPRIGFHRSGADAIAIVYEGGTSLTLWSNTGNRYDLWHGGNFNPNGKANLGTPSPGSIHLTGGAAAYYLRDRDSNRDWALYAHGDRVALFNGGGDVVTITPWGSITANGGFDDGSSYRLKRDLKPLPYGLAEVERIVTRIGRYRDFYNRDDRLRLFVLAEQLRGVLPEAVNDDGLVIDGERYATVQYSQLMPPVIVSVQQLAANARDDRAELAKVRDSLDTLRSEFAAFRERVMSLSEGAR
ncbi:hypothetical protein [Lysobacter firmicutimachus]|uniref:Peptidase S74 domain-containing protein n=1 Tax=Lysobacter firmicutimachus TaxID=1792846 RepID=A0ABU8D0P2_9GAMM